MQALCLRIYFALGKLLSLFEQPFQCSLFSIQLDLCDSYHCPNYYAQLTHESFLMLTAVLLILSFLL